jgi:hypothetical protein
MVQSHHRPVPNIVLGSVLNIDVHLDGSKIWCRYVIKLFDDDVDFFPRRKVLLYQPTVDTVYNTYRPTTYRKIQPYPQLSTSTPTTVPANLLGPAAKRHCGTHRVRDRSDKRKRNSSWVSFSLNRCCTFIS